MRLRLALFDLDGTLVDSQGHIVGAMEAAFAAVGRQAPGRADVLGCVGLSLPRVFERLAPGADHGPMLAAYKNHYAEARAAGVPPLFPGAARMLEDLGAVPEVLVGLATGASRRGMTSVAGAHGFRLATAQCADDHPSKPHPAMVQAALAETGVAPEDAVMIGDSGFDMEMARAGGVFALGVSWGYQAVDRLRASGAQDVVERPADVAPRLMRMWEL